MALSFTIHSFTRHSHASGTGLDVVGTSKIQSLLSKELTFQCWERQAVAMHCDKSHHGEHRRRERYEETQKMLHSRVILDS